ncbi:MAG: DNA polymerase III subunit delta [Prevotellaceae bacterium]|jgi:DNA polymerase-3 subunit delta|nr:DNA polymerase III subunit delta [Prevotellaceae bacterium]
MAKKTITYEQILSDLKQKQYAPVYLLTGEEAYYIDLISDFIQNNVLDEMEREFNLTVLYGKDTDISSVINAAKRYPMMSNYQVVIVKEAQHIKAWDNLAYYLQKPLNSTILVLCYKYGVPDKRKKWVLDIDKAGVVFESQKLRDYETAGWIAQYAKSKNIQLDEKATALLAEFLGSDLSKIANELNKLALTIAAGTRITPDIIEKNIGISKDYNVFELQAALINRDVLKANRIIRYFADNKKNNPLVLVLGQLFNFFSNLMLYHYLNDKSQMTVASELKINPYFVKDYAKAARIFGAWKTMNIISHIRETDARSKGVENSGADDGDLMKELIYRILH